MPIYIYDLDAGFIGPWTRGTRHASGTVYG